MSFFQSLHLNNGHTIKSTRGFKKAPGQSADDNYNNYNLNNTDTNSKSGNGTGSNTNYTLNNPNNANNQNYTYNQAQQRQSLPAQLQNSHHTAEDSYGHAHNHNYNSISTHKDIKSIVESTLGSGTALAQAVKLPKDENLNEWLAVHIVDFYNQINMLYGTITEFCSPATCPRMIATSEYEYLWQDSNLSKPVSVSAPKYVESLMTWIQSLFDDENVFPSKMGQPFPPQFQSLVKTVMKRLFRIYAHIYCHHFNEVIELGLNTLLNTSFKHFLLFADEFNLVSQKDYGPLQTLVMEMLTQDDI